MDIATQCSQCGNGICQCIHRKASYKLDAIKSGAKSPTPAPTTYEHKVISYNPANFILISLLRKSHLILFQSECRNETQTLSSSLNHSSFSAYN